MLAEKTYEKDCTVKSLFFVDSIISLDCIICLMHTKVCMSKVAISISSHFWPLTDKMIKYAETLPYGLAQST